ncbi:hypothetical protein BJ165DRAFT_1486713 [Panaeolus papilionaceus]|nr:hypothetical protein BJ165DRAFT_1486713 [Panaeolus papilionaceus]
MAPQHPLSSDSSDDDDNAAPEAVSLNQSKKQIQKLECDVKTAALAQKLNKKRQNQERDRKLKERAEINKQKQAKGKGVAKQGQEADPEEDSDEDSENEFGSDDESGSEDELQARMRRAMQEAEEEDSDAFDEEDDEGEEWGGIGEGSGNSDGEDEDDSQASDSQNSKDEEEEFDDDEEHYQNESEDEEEEVPQRKPQRGKSNPDHLPDELFAAAFASQAQENSPSKPKRKASDREQQASRPGKKRRPNTPKDIVIGKSTAVRLLPNSASKPPIPLALPSKKINHFLDRSLALKGGKQRKKAWERRPANLGVLRQNGPATHFVRSR